MTDHDTAREGVLSPQYLAVTLGAFTVIALVAFEALAVTTVMPTLARDLDGVHLYALGFAAPLASGVVGMVVAGMWADRGGPAAPLLTALLVFSSGLAVAGLAPTMEVFVAGRVLQGLGGGAATVGLYVVVGLIFPPRLQPSIFAAFAAAWVLPALFGPALEAIVADAVGWRWVFGGTVFLVIAVAGILAPRMLRLPRPTDPAPRAPWIRLGWAVVAAASVLGVELLEDRLALSVVCLLLVGISLVRLLPAGTLRLARGLPAVIASRGLLAGSFFCAEAYIVFVLGEKWGITPTVAGIALTAVGIMWAAASQVQARLPRLAHSTVMTIGTSMVLGGLVLLTMAITWEWSPWAAAGVYVLAGTGMGFAYPRTGVSMLEHSTEADRGANSSALSAADSLGAAVALAVTGICFSRAEQAGVDPFVPVYVLGVAVACLGVLSATRTRAVR